MVGVLTFSRKVLVAMLAIAPPLRAAESMGQTFSPAYVCRAPDGSAELSVSSTTEGCEFIELPAPVSKVLWARWVPKPMAPGTSSVQVDGTGYGSSFNPLIVRFGAPSSENRTPPAPLPVGISLLGRLTPRPYGLEERVTIEAKPDALEIDCRVGEKQAGVVLQPGHAQFPRNVSAQLKIWAEGSKGFSAGLAVQGGTPASTEPLRAGSPLTLRPSTEFAPSSIPWLVLTCPAEGGTLSVKNVEVIVTQGQRRPVPRSAWAWEESLWREEGSTLIARAVNAGINRLIVSVQVEDGRIRDEDAFHTFVAKARRNGIDIVIVEGDPAMALDHGRTVALTRLAAIEQYQRDAPAASKISGVQYDIEPYSTQAYANYPSLVLAGWAETFDALWRATTLPLDIVLPWWLADNAEASAVLGSAKRAASIVTVMAYRTRSEEIQIAAEPFLAWGQQNGVPIHVALEAGPVEPESSRTYLADQVGELVVLPHENGSLIVQFNEPLWASRGTTFRMGRDLVTTAERTSFLGDRDRMARVANDLLTIFCAWSSFSGLAFHGYID